MKSVIHKRNFLLTWGLLATVLGGVGQTALASVSTGNSVTAPLQQNTTTEGRMQTSGTAWGLSDKEWQQYQQVLKGPRATQSPGIDPLMALGLEAKSASERRHFAEMWVREEYARVEKELAFQREVDAAWKRLYPNTLSVNMGNASGIAHDTQGRLALFVKQNCVQCDARLSAVLADMVAMVEGLSRRDLRRYGAGYESSFLYHHAKRFIKPSAIYPCMLYLSWPTAIYPNLVLLPAALLLGTSVTVLMSTLKKYL